MTLLTLAATMRYNATSLLAGDEGKKEQRRTAMSLAVFYSG